MSTGKTITTGHRDPPESLMTQKTRSSLGQEPCGFCQEALKEEKKSLKEIQENTIKQVKELQKALQDLKLEVETIKKIQTWEWKT